MSEESEAIDNMSAAVCTAIGGVTAQLIICNIRFATINSRLSDIANKLRDIITPLDSINTNAGLIKDVLVDVETALDIIARTDIFVDFTFTKKILDVQVSLKSQAVTS